MSCPPRSSIALSAQKGFLIIRNSKAEGARRFLFPEMTNRRPSQMLCATFRACGFLHHGNGRRTFRLRRNWPRAREQWAPTRVFRGKAPRRHQRNKWRQAINYPAPTHHTSSSGWCDPHEDRRERLSGLDRITGILPLTRPDCPKGPARQEKIASRNPAGSTRGSLASTA